MSIQRPNHEQLATIIKNLGMSMDENEVNFFLENLQGVFDRYDLIDSMPDNITPVLYPRTSGYRPTKEENPHNAWYLSLIHI